MSKVLIIPPDKESSQISKITSGQEKVARDQAIILSRNGYNVDYLTVYGLEDLSTLGFNHIRMHDVKPRSFFQSKRPNPQTEKKKIWASWIARQNYDYIILHVDSTVFPKELCKLGLGKKIISFIHNPFAGTTWGIGFNSGQGRIKKEGGKIVAVSEKCKNIWNEWHSSVFERFTNNPSSLNVSRPDLLNLDLVHPDFIENIFCPQLSNINDEIKNPNGRGVVLCRIAEEKAIHTTFGNNLIYILSSDDEKYYQKIKDKLEKEEVYLNMTHEQCMEKLSEASFLVSTWSNETSGINAFEAAERGIPSILCVDSSGIHASMEFLEEDSYVTYPKGKKLPDIPKEWSDMKFRKALSQRTRENFSVEQYLQNLKILLEDTKNISMSKKIPHLFF